jgi:outer membrane protein
LVEIAKCFRTIFAVRVKVSVLKFLLSFLLLLNGLVAISFAQETWSLQKCIEYAYAHNLQIKQSQINTEISKSQYLQSKLDLFPNLNASASYGVNYGKNIDPTSNQFTSQNIESGQASVTSAVTLFGGFSKLNEMKSKYYNYMASRYAQDQMTNDISLAVANGYLQVLYAKELLQKTTENLSLAEKQVVRMQALVNAGASAEGALFEIQALAASEELNKVNAENQLAIALLNLQQLLDLDKPIEVEAPGVELTPENLQPLPGPQNVFDIAVKTYPSVLSAQFNVNAAERGFQAARGRRSPTLSGFANLSTNYSNAVKRLVSVDTTGTYTPIGLVYGSNEVVVTPDFNYNFANTPFKTQLQDNFGQAIGVSLSVPIFNGWSTNSFVRQSRLQLQSSQISYEQQRNTLQKDINTAHADASAAAKRYTAAVTQLTSTEKAFQYAQQRFNAGIIAALDFDQSRRNYNAAQSDLLQAKYDYIFRLKVLDYYQGKPLTLP